MIIPFKSDKIATQQLIELIHSFPLSTSFFQWLAAEDLVTQTSFEQKSAEKFERLGEYRIDNLKVFAGGGEFSLSHMHTSFSQSLDKGPHQYYSMLSELAKLEKRKVSATLLDQTYTVISQFFYFQKLCGTCWEVYHMDNLHKVYTKRKLEPKQADISARAPSS